MNNSQIKIFALGGLDENGKNMYCIEVNNDIYIVESGLKYPESQYLGIDIEIPNIEYLIENKNRIKAVFISHAHPDAMGCIEYLIKEINVPIYATQLTSWLIEDKLKKLDNVNYLIKRIKENSIIKLDNDLRVHTFKTTHSITHSVGFAFETNQGFIVFPSDYIIDFGAIDEYQTDLHKIVDISKKGVLALMSESVSAANEGHTSPKHRISNIIENTIADAKGRIIVTAYTHSVFNIKEIVDLGIKYNYRIVILNPDLQDLVHKHDKLKMPIIPSASRAKMSDIEHNDVLVIVSGNGADLFEQLSEIATGGSDIIKTTNLDTFIIASPPIPGIEHISIKAIDDIYRSHANVKIISSKQIASMHASKEDLKMFINLLRPKYYIPIKGDYTHMIANGNIAYDMGIDKDNVLILENGEVVTFENKELKEEKEYINAGSILIDGQNINDSQGVVLNDRLSLSQDGTIIIGVALDKVTKKVAASIDIQTRGFIFLKDSEHIINHIHDLVKESLELYTFKGDRDFIDAKSKIREVVSKYVYKETAKRPIVLSMIITI